MSELPTLYKNPRSRFWYYSFCEPGKPRIRHSCRVLGLTQDVPQSVAFARVCEALGLVEEAPETGQESLGWFLGCMEVRRDLRVRESTWALYVRDFKIFVEFMGLDFPLAGIKRVPTVVRFQDYLLTKGWLPVSVNRACRNTQAVLRRAVTLGYLEYNPLSGFERLREAPGMAYMEENELERFLAVVREWQPVVQRKRPEHYEGLKRLVMIYLYIPYRRGEILSLRRDAINIQARQIKIANSKRRLPTPVIIDIPDEIIQDISWFLDTFQSDTPFYLCHPDTLTHQFKIWLRLAGMPDLHLHNLRHTALSLAANQPGANIRALQQLVQHSSLTMTEHYVHGKSLGKVTFGKNYNAQKGKNSE